MYFTEASNKDGKLSKDEKNKRMDNLKKGREKRDKMADKNKDGEVSDMEKVNYMNKKKIQESCMFIGCLSEGYWAKLILGQESGKIDKFKERYENIKTKQQQKDLIEDINEEIAETDDHLKSRLKTDGVRVFLGGLLLGGITSVIARSNLKKYKEQLESILSKVKSKKVK
jgi:hypothetical protein